jgi:hypothetical protein
MFRKILFSTVLALTIIVAALFAAHATSAGTTPQRSQRPAALGPALVTPTPNFKVVQDSQNEVWLNGWGGYVEDTGFSYRSSVLQGETVKFKFTGTSVKWITDKTSAMGIAQVSIDGVNKGNFDLYRASSLLYTPITFSGLSNSKHTIVVKNTGQKNVHSSNTVVVVAAFVVGSTTYTANSHRITYSEWRGVFDSSASGGSYRTNVGGSQILLHFTGTYIKWITATGPSYGKAWVIIDGVSKGYVDLYSSTPHSQITKTYSSLGTGSHSIQLVPLGQKNAASSGYGVVVDAFIVSK